MHIRHAPWLLALSLLLLPPANARAAPLFDDDLDDALPRAFEPRDADPVDLAAQPGSPLWLSVSLTVERGEERSSLGGLLLLSLPLDRVAQRPRRTDATRAAFAEPPAPKSPAAPAAREPSAAPPAPRPALVPPALKPAEPKDATPPPPAAAAPKLTPAETPLAPPPAPLLRVSVAAARAAVRAALVRRRLLAPDADLDALSARARQASLLPELRLRATRLVEEAQNLAPTEYDPARTTASGGTSLWLEARATWRLDRLVFADDEVAIERMRRDRSEAQREVASRVLELLFEWQRVTTRLADPKRSDDERTADAVRLVEVEAELDVETDGWLSRWRGAEVHE